MNTETDKKENLNVQHFIFSLTLLLLALLMIINPSNAL